MWGCAAPGLKAWVAELSAEAGLWFARRPVLMTGVDVGLTNHVWYAELQLARNFRVYHDTGYVLGLSAGPAWARDADRAWGGQVTVWALAILQFPVPLVPYARVQHVGGETAVSAGAMLKVGVPLAGFGTSRVRK